MTIELNSSWLHGKYVIDNQNVEINTSLPYISIEGYRTDFFSQGEDAENIIEEIRLIWVSGDITQSEAIQRWINTNL